MLSILNNDGKNNRNSYADDRLYQRSPMTTEKPVMEVHIVPDYIWSNIKSDPNNLIEKLSKYDKEDYQYTDGILKQLITDYLGIEVPISNRETSFDLFLNQIALKHDLTNLFGSNVESCRKVFTSLFAQHAGDGSKELNDKIKTIDMSIIKGEAFAQFVTYKLVNNSVFIILNNGFTNLCCRKPLFVFLCLIEGLLNFVVRNFNEDIIASSSDLYKFRNALIRLSMLDKE